jgi:hypothetical protein
MTKGELRPVHNCPLTEEKWHKAQGAGREVLDAKEAAPADSCKLIAEGEIESSHTWI